MTTEIGEKKTVRVYLRIDTEGDVTACTQWDRDSGTELSDSIDGSVHAYRDYVIAVTLPIPSEDRLPDATVEVLDVVSDPSISATQVA
jgi:hypothetical protein